MVEPISTDIDHGGKGNLGLDICRWNTREAEVVSLYLKPPWHYLQPVNLLIMCKLEDELVYYTINANCTTNKLELGVGRVVEDKVVPVKVCQLLSTDSASQLQRVSILNYPNRHTYCWNMVNVWFLDHCTHGVLNRPISKFVVCVFLPNSFEVKVRSFHSRFEKLKISRVRQRL